MEDTVHILVLWTNDLSWSSSSLKQVSSKVKMNLLVQNSFFVFQRTVFASWATAEGQSGFFVLNSNFISSNLHVQAERVLHHLHWKCSQRGSLCGRYEQEKRFQQRKHISLYTWACQTQRNKNYVVALLWPLDLTDLLSFTIIWFKQSKEFNF